MSKCNFDAQQLASSYFCKFFLQIMHGNPAFCVVFPAEKAPYEIVVAFHVDIDYIVNRGSWRLQKFENEVFFMLAVISACGAAYFAGMIFMTVKGMKE